MLTATLLGTVAFLAHGCGQGLFDRHSLVDDAAGVDDAGAEPDEAVGPQADDAAKPGDDARKHDDVAKPFDDAGRPPDDAPKPPDDVARQPIDEITKTFTVDGGSMSLGPATLTIAPGTFRTPTPITIREFASIDHTGAYGPVFEISVPSINLFQLDCVLTLSAPSVGEFQPNLALGMLNPALSLAEQQWVPPQDSKLSDDQKTLTGALTELQKFNVIDVAAVIKCPSSVGCPAHQQCNSGACQQCPNPLNCP